MIKSLSDFTEAWKITHETYFINGRKSRLSSPEQIEGKYGVIYQWEGERLAVSSENPRIVSKLSHTPGLQQISWYVFLFDSSLLDTIARIIRARKQRRLSEDHRKALHNSLRPVKKAA